MQGEEESSQTFIERRQGTTERQKIGYLKQQGKIPGSSTIEFKSMKGKKHDPIKIQSKSKQSQKLSVSNKSLSKSQDIDQTNKFLISIEYQGCGQKKSQELFRSTKPWSADEIFHYLQIHVRQVSTKMAIWVGLTASTSKFQIPGLSENSIGLKMYADSERAEVFQNGSKIFDSHEDLVFQKLKSLNEEDCIGCGFCPYKNLVFFTLNGQKFTPKIKMVQGKRNEKEKIQIIQYCPSIALQSRNPTKIDVIFQNGSEHFRYDYQEKCESLRYKLVKHQILDQAAPCALKSNITPFSDIEQNQFNLVRNYLRFHGYDRSAEQMESEMKKRNIRYKRTNRPVKNQERYDKRFEDELKDFDKEGKQKKIKKEEKKKKKTLEKKNILFYQKATGNDSDNSIHFGDTPQDSSCSSDQKSDSEEEYSFKTFMGRGDFLPQQMRRSRKKIEHPNERKERRLREKKEKEEKQSKQLIQKFQHKVEKIKKNEQRLFNKQRVDILRFLRVGKLQISLKIMEEHFPNIVETECYLKAYFKALNFMKVCCEENASAGFKILKEEQKQFQKYENCFFPFYKLADNGQIRADFRPLRDILFLLCPGERQKMILEHQLDIFSQFIGKLICEKMGFIGGSDLELIFQHFQKVKQKIEQIGAPVGGIKLQ